MSAIKLAYYRIYQSIFNIGARALPWRKAVRVEGSGSIAELPGLLRKHGVAMPMAVTDPGLMKAGVAPRILTKLDEAGIPYALFDKVEPNPSVNTANSIAALYREQGCDGFIAIGGGSAMDAAKGTAALILRPRKTLQQLGGLLKVHKRMPTFIAIPTTAGTGSETTIAAVITDTDTHHKYAVMDLSLVPHYAILDPELTLGLPGHITSTTGMDALTHAVEAYLSWTYNTKESIRFAEEAVATIFAYLERAYNDGSYMEAREQMLLASFKAGFAFTRAGVGNVHTVAHTLGGRYGTPHGLANAVILPVVLEDYGEKVHGKLARLAMIAGVGEEGKSDAHNAQLFISAIYAMNERMGIPKGFDFIRDEDLPQMVKYALKECNPFYPVPVVYDTERCRNIYEQVRIKAYRIGEDCTGCTACAQLCPVEAISGERDKRHEVNAARCVCCGVCGKTCPASAITDQNGNTCVRVPRSEWPKPVVDESNCTACGLCVEACRFGALGLSLPQFQGDIDVHAVLEQPKKCVSCGLCADECAISAITI